MRSRSKEPLSRTPSFPTCISLREEDVARLDDLKEILGIRSTSDAFRLALKLAHNRFCKDEEDHG